MTVGVWEYGIAAPTLPYSLPYSLILQTSAYTMANQSREQRAVRVFSEPVRQTYKEKVSFFGPATK